MANVIDLDTARPELRALLARAQNPLAVHKVMATAATRTVRDTFAKVATWQRNPFGKAPQFWKRMSRATRPEATIKTAAVVMPREVAQRYFGGVIRPTGGRRLLTIPAVAESYRRSARSFEDLVMWIFNKPRRGAVGALVRPSKVVVWDKAALAAEKRRGGRGWKNARMLSSHDGKEGFILFWLYRSVRQKGDRRVVPTMQEIGAAVVPEVESYLLRKAATKA